MVYCSLRSAGACHANSLVLCVELLCELESHLALSSVSSFCAIMRQINDGYANPGEASFVKRPHFSWLGRCLISPSVASSLPGSTIPFFSPRLCTAGTGDDVLVQRNRSLSRTVLALYVQVPLALTVAIMSKRKDLIPAEEDETMEIMPLGAGNEVGRSCVYMKYKGKHVLVRTVF